jgi:glycerol-3-phosphate dehydrogenase (NAD(P)+)
MASPSFPARAVGKAAAPYIDEDAVVVSITKGLEDKTFRRMSEVVAEETGHEVVVLTGPSHAEEVALSVPTGCLAACENKTLAEFVQDAFMSDTFRVYTSPDPVGAELGAALKNVIALCAGITDGLGCGDNTKAMLMTRGLTETARLGVALGAKKETFTGLAGVGDLIVTCTSMHSRNRRAGILIGQGKDAQTAMQEVGAVVEGYYAAKSAWELGQAKGIDMPITEAAYRVLYEGANVKDAFLGLMNRQKKAESENPGWL